MGEVLALYARDQGPTLAAPATLAYCREGAGAVLGLPHLRRREGLYLPRLRGAARRCDRDRPARARRAASRPEPRPRRGTADLRAEGDAGRGRRSARPLADPCRGRGAPAGTPRPHVRRFIVLALASGRRAAAILDLRLGPSLDAGWIDTGAASSTSRERVRGAPRSAAARLQAPRVLAAHTRRWRGSHAILWRGKPVAEIDTGLRAAARRAGLEGVTPHVLKHTAVTWAFQRGMTLEDAADWFATSPATLMKHYRAHSPHYQSRARAIMEGNRNVANNVAPADREIC